MGYLVAHHEVVNQSRSVPVGWGRGALMVVIGFGAWLIGGGFAVDRHALEWTGFDSVDADIAAVALSGLELALLTPAAWLCALLLGNATVPAVLVYRLADFALTRGAALIASSAVERGLIRASSRVPGD